jgi:hypothetical protein
MATQHGFWIDTTDNRVFDGIVIRHLIAHGDILAINAFYQSPESYQPPAYSFADIVRRLKAASSAVRVLFYTWAGRKRTEADTIGAVPTLDGWEIQRPDIRLMNNEGRVLTSGEDGPEFTFLDPRKSHARDWLSMRVRETANRIGSDGVALDGAIRSPDFLDLIETPDVEPRYPEAFDFMIQDITARTPLTIFNNLSARPDQEHLLGYAHGASIERFGLNDLIARPPTFAADILPYLDAIGRHPDRTFLVYGRASRNEEPYTTYEEDWRWQRYLYCAYLLRAGANTRWKQHAGFLASPSGGRAGGLEVYSDALHDLGAALGDSRVDGGCYRRAFQRGLVLVVPSESQGPCSVLIEESMYTSEGARVFGNLIVTPG